MASTYGTPNLIFSSFLHYLTWINFFCSTGSFFFSLISLSFLSRRAPSLAYYYVDSSAAVKFTIFFFYWAFGFSLNLRVAILAYCCVDSSAADKLLIFP